jgi:cell wall-associated NlpC family hydrolase
MRTFASAGALAAAGIITLSLMAEPALAAPPPHSASLKANSAPSYGIHSQNANNLSASRFGKRVVAAAKKEKGTAYSYGAGDIHGPSYGIGRGKNIYGYDCGGLTQYAIYKASGGRIKLPHRVTAQSYKGKAISWKNRKAGDLILFAENGEYGHVGVYIGGNKMVSAIKSDVHTSSVNVGFWHTRKVRRFS